MEHDRGEPGSSSVATPPLLHRVTLHINRCMHSNVTYPPKAAAADTTVAAEAAAETSALSGSRSMPVHLRSYRVERLAARVASSALPNQQSGRNVACSGLSSKMCDTLDALLENSPCRRVHVTPQAFRLALSEPCRATEHVHRGRASPTRSESVRRRPPQQPPPPPQKRQPQQQRQRLPPLAAASAQSSDRGGDSAVVARRSVQTQTRRPLAAASAQSSDRGGDSAVVARRSVQTQTRPLAVCQSGTQTKQATAHAATCRGRGTQTLAPNRSDIAIQVVCWKVSTHTQTTPRAPTTTTARAADEKAVVLPKPEKALTLPSPSASNASVAAPPMDHDVEGGGPCVDRIVRRERVVARRALRTLVAQHKDLVYHMTQQRNIARRSLRMPTPPFFRSPTSPFLPPTPPPPFASADTTVVETEEEPNTVTVLVTQAETKTDTPPPPTPPPPFGANASSATTFISSDHRHKTSSSALV